jgi:hypothetical protein
MRQEQTKKVFEKKESCNLRPRSVLWGCVSSFSMDPYLSTDTAAGDTGVFLRRRWFEKGGLLIKQQ